MRSYVLASYLTGAVIVLGIFSAVFGVGTATGQEFDTPAANAGAKGRVVLPPSEGVVLDPHSETFVPGRPAGDEFIPAADVPVLRDDVIIHRPDVVWPHDGGTVTVTGRPGVRIDSIDDLAGLSDEDLRRLNRRRDVEVNPFRLRDDVNRGLFNLSREIRGLDFRYHISGVRNASGTAWTASSGSRHSEGVFVPAADPRRRR